MSVIESARASNYEFLGIYKDNRSRPVTIAGKTVSMDYYESVYSPTVTAILQEVDTGGTVISNDTGLKGTLKDALPIEGFEELGFTIRNSSSSRPLSYGIDQPPLLIKGTPNILEDGTSQSVLLNAASKHEFDNAQTPIRSYYRGRINETVDNLLQELGVPPSRRFIEPTQNNEAVTGRSRSPFDIILSLCKKAIPVQGDPGFFFYQTQDGFNFRSIDSLIKEGSSNIREYDWYKDTHTYSYNPGWASGSSDKQKGINNFKILDVPHIIKDQDVLESLENGTYSVRFITTNPLTFEVKEEVVNLLSKTNVGKQQIFDSNIDSNKFHATYSTILDVGSYEPGISKIELNSPVRWDALANMRYNLLHAQLMEIQVPSNLNLRAGEVVRVNLANVTLEDKALSMWNQNRSGDYLILHLCHHFDPENSYTSMTLARDTYGLYKSVNY